MPLTDTRPSTVAVTDFESVLPTGAGRRPSSASFLVPRELGVYSYDLFSARKKHFPTPVAVTWTIEKTMRFVHWSLSTEAPPPERGAVPQVKTGSLTSVLVVTGAVLTSGALAETNPVFRSAPLTVSDTFVL